MRNSLKIILLLLLPLFAHPQQNTADSLKELLPTASNDSVRHELYRRLYNYYEELNRDSALYYAQLRTQLAKKNNRKLVEAISLALEGYQSLHLGRYAAALQLLLEAFRIAEDPSNEVRETWRLTDYPSPGKERLFVLTVVHHMYAILMEQTQNVGQQIAHFSKAQQLAIEINNQYRIMLADMNLANSYLGIDKLDSALFFGMEAKRVLLETKINKFMGFIFCVLGDIYLKKGDTAQAKHYYYEGIASSVMLQNISSLARNNSRLIQYYIEEGKADSVLSYAKRNLQVVQSIGAIVGQTNNMGTAYENLYIGYKLTHQFDSAFKYQGLALVTKDSLYRERIKNLAEFQNLTFSEQLRLQDLAKEKRLYQSRVRVYTLLIGLGILLLIGLILFRNNRQKQKTNKVLEKTLDDLKSTQSQLVQSEKMASLGELTAGIAHEIQNPLNFVNNFSEVSVELTKELVDEVDKGNTKEAKAIADDLVLNLEKINHHGKRADAIVKGMLQHSRSSSGQKEPTDINALADEYLRLAYHGLRAKDKSFNATLKTDYDESIGKINIIPQDIGRVILNLITNAFYVVEEKKKLLPNNHQPIATAYEPTVSVSTKKLNGKIEIRVTDNGNGIPQKVMDKIFQPFFTTKPTGQGTGLGLSLSYDIVKAHGGELKVETKEGEGTAFIILIPAN